LILCCVYTRSWFLLPHGAMLRVAFEPPGADLQEVVFTRLPLGLSFSKALPLSVDTVESASHAEELGVQPGWLVATVGGRDLRVLGLRSALRSLKESAASLPGYLKVQPSCPAAGPAQNCCDGYRSDLMVFLGNRQEAQATPDAPDRMLLYRCKTNAGLGNCLLMFLTFARRASIASRDCVDGNASRSTESAENNGTFDTVLFDGTSLPLYGDVSALFPQLPPAGTTAVADQRSRSFGRCGSFAGCRGVYERRGPLLPNDVEIGRPLASRHLRLAAPVEALLLDAASALGLEQCLGVHVRRTDKGREAPSNLTLSITEAAKAAAQRAREIDAVRVFLASDDAAFLTELAKELEAIGFPTVAWGSHLPSKAGRPCHYDWTIPGLEKAADALADCFLLARCKGILSTYSSLSTIATLWSAPEVTWRHFDLPAGGRDSVEPDGNTESCDEEGSEAD